ncbi:MAG: patatin-like phospholipase family protein, partial [Nitrosopumilus sp.]|nr:patatin-like phospholipase family protein [Nitrosopumilus sp.]
LHGAGGTSIGAFIMFAVLAGMSVHEIYTLLKNLDNWDMYRLIKTIDIKNISHNGGLCDHTLLKKFVQKLFIQLGYKENMTFKEFYKKTGKYFLCNSSCTSTNDIYLMDHERTPDMYIKNALVMSMCLPVLFKPVTYDNKLYVDGGYFRNYIINYFPAKETMGIRIADNLHSPLLIQKTSELFTLYYLMRLCLCQCKVLDMHQWKTLDSEHVKNTIILKTPSVDPMDPVSTLKIDNKVIETLTRDGFNSTISVLYAEKILGLAIIVIYHLFNFTQKQISNSEE